MGLNREDLDRMRARWRESVSDEDHHLQRQLDALLAAERAFVDREAQARVLRWVAPYFPELRKVADLVESGEVEVP